MSSEKIDVTKDRSCHVTKEIIREGTSGSAMPMKGDRVTVHYVGKLTDGSVFDSSRDRGEPFTFTLGQGEVIKGWDLAVQTMKAGEIASVTIEPKYGYGEAGSPPKIPPNSVLIFEIELIKWEMKDISKDSDKSICKRIIDEGEGYSMPQVDAICKIHIKGIYNDRVFEEREVSFIVGEGIEAGLIYGVERGVKKMKKGETCRLHIKPKCAWNNSPPAEFNIPSDYEEVIYEVKLIDFEKVKQAWEMTLDEKMAASELAKSKGNEFFKADKPFLALRHYEKIVRNLGPAKNEAVDKIGEEEDPIEGKPDDDVDPEKKKQLLLAGYLNVAICQLKLKNYTPVVKNATYALRLDPGNVKGLYRRALGYEGMQNYESARSDLESLIKIEPDNKAAQAVMARVQKNLSAQLEKEKALYSRMMGGLISDKKKDKKIEEKKKEDDQKIWDELKNEDTREFKLPA